MSHGRPVIFGEVLFDCFENNQTVLGGAPFNVAWHLQRFSCAPQLISSVGDDEYGGVVRNTMRKQGMDTSGLQTSEKYPTGKVAVTLQDGQPSYDIVKNAAYDHISKNGALDALSGQLPALVYHGSLALRTSESKATLEAILQKHPAPIFLDINLRAPWWEMSLLETILKRATWVKLNDEELCIVCQEPLSDGPELLDYARNLFTSCQLERLIVTRGEHGAFVVSKDGIIEGQPVAVENIVDTVGAGDAFSAATIAGILEGLPIQESLNKALSFAAEVCQQQGATS